MKSKNPYWKKIECILNDINIDEILNDVDLEEVVKYFECTAKKIKRSYKISLVELEYARAKIIARRKLREIRRLQNCSQEELKYKVKKAFIDKIYSKF